MSWHQVAVHVVVQEQEAMYKSDSIDHVFLGGHADSLTQDFKAAIADLLNWTTAN